MITKSQSVDPEWLGRKEEDVGGHMNPLGRGNRIAFMGSMLVTAGDGIRDLDKFGRGVRWHV